MQSRFVLPGWYGLGSALADVLSDEDGRAMLREMYAHWPFFQTMLDNAQQSLTKADMGIAAVYASLVTDEELRARMFDLIKAEFDRTCEAIFSITGQKALMENEPVLQRSIQLRNPYVDPLNYIQVEMLRRLRLLRDPEGEEAEALREVVVLTINGIASGLRNTG